MTVFYLAAELIGMDDLRDTVFFQETSQEGLRGFDVPILLEEDALHEHGFVHGPSNLVSNAIDAQTHPVGVSGDAGQLRRAS